MGIPTAFTPCGRGDVYVVKRGDTLTKIIQNSKSMCLADPASHVDRVLKDNPHITNRDLIYPGQLICLRRSFDDTSDFSNAVLNDIVEANRQFSQLPPSDQDTAANAGWVMQIAANSLSSAAQTQLRLGAQRGQSTLQAIHDVDLPARGAYEINAAQFNKRAQVRQSVAMRDMGFMRYWLGRDPVNALRWSSTSRLSVRQQVTQQIDKIKRGARYVRHGGLVVTVATESVVACRDISTSKSAMENNRTLFGSTGSIFGGLVGGGLVGGGAKLLAGTALVATPAGWATALLIGGIVVGGGIGSFFGRRAGKAAHNISGVSYDIAGFLYIDELCSD